MTKLTIPQVKDIKFGKASRRVLMQRHNISSQTIYEIRNGITWSHIMSELKCGSCTTCCQWGEDKAIRPVLDNSELKLECDYFEGGFILKAKPNGDCVYLGNKGCTIYSDRPLQCRVFDCRELYTQMKDSTFIKVIFMGKERWSE